MKTKCDLLVADLQRKLVFIPPGAAFNLDSMHAQDGEGSDITIRRSTTSQYHLTISPQTVHAVSARRSRRLSTIQLTGVVRVSKKVAGVQILLPRHTRSNKGLDGLMSWTFSKAIVVVEKVAGSEEDETL